MATLRARLTIAYGFALVGNVMLFAGALYFAHNARAQQLRQRGLVGLGAQQAAHLPLGFL